MTVTTAVENLIDFGKIMDNFTREYSPITMNSEWSWMWRVFFLTIVSGLGTILNAFFVATFTVSQELRKKGNIFLACLGLTDMIITAFVIPTVVVAILSQINESTVICKALQFMTQWSTYSYSLLFMLVAVDIYARLVRGYTCYRVFITYPYSTIAVLSFIVSFVTAGVGVYFDFDYDYCNREHLGDYWFRVGTSITFYLIPSAITIYLLLYTSIVMKSRIETVIRYRRYRKFAQDKDLTYLHLGCYTIFASSWIPYLLLVNLHPDASDAKFYTLIWIGLVRSSITSLLYITFDKNFREAFRDLFNYMCCKGELMNNNRRFYNTSNGVLVLSNSNSPGRQRRQPNIHYVM